MINTMLPLLWILIAFLSGALPTSVWLGKIFLGKDIRQFGDGNPGATNVFRAGSPILGVTSLLLDVTKAALPVAICYFYLGFHGFSMLLIATAPVIGHVFSPFLGFKGGKALAASLGIWIGLTIWKASLPAVIGVTLGILVLNTTGWAVMLAMLAILASLLTYVQIPLFYIVWLLQTLILAWTHRQDLSHMPGLKKRNQQSGK